MVMSSGSGWFWLLEGRLLEDGVDVALAQDHEFLATQLHLSAAVLGEEYGVADVDFDGLAVAVVEQLAATDGDDLAALALLLGGVGQHEAAGGGLRLLDDFHHDLVA